MVYPFYWIVINLMISWLLMIILTNSFWNKSFHLYYLKIKKGRATTQPHKSHQATTIGEKQKLCVKCSGQKWVIGRTDTTFFFLFYSGCSFCFFTVVNVCWQMATVFLSFVGWLKLASYYLLQKLSEK